MTHLNPQKDILMVIAGTKDLLFEERLCRLVLYALLLKGANFTRGLKGNVDVSLGENLDWPFGNVSIKKVMNPWNSLRGPWWLIDFKVLRGSWDMGSVHKSDTVEKGHL